jgi:hypothetical protein
MTLVKGKQEAVTPRERADFLAAQTALAERVTRAESKVTRSLELAQRALDAANSALNALPQCVSVELATSLQTQINGAVTGINDLNGRLTDVKTQLDTRPSTDNPAAAPVDVEDLAMLRSALDDALTMEPTRPNTYARHWTLASTLKPPASLNSRNPLTTSNASPPCSSTSRPNRPWTSTKQPHASRKRYHRPTAPT